jgi:hypothetical protein
MRTAISPRFAIRTLSDRHGREPSGRPVCRHGHPRGRCVIGACSELPYDQPSPCAPARPGRHPATRLRGVAGARRRGEDRRRRRRWTRATGTSTPRGSITTRRAWAGRSLHEQPATAPRRSSSRRRCGTTTSPTPAPAFEASRPSGWDSTSSTSTCIHWPFPGWAAYVEAWEILVALRGEGRVRVDRGVATSMWRTSRPVGRGQRASMPAINQIELHPYLQQRELRAFHAEHGIVTEAWSPLASGKQVLDDPVIAASPPSTASRRRRRSSAGTWRPRQCGDPEVGDPEPDRGEFRRLRDLVGRRGPGGDRRPRPGDAHRPQPATSSTSTRSRSGSETSSMPVVPIRGRRNVTASGRARHARSRRPWAGVRARRVRPGSAPIPSPPLRPQALAG